MGHATLRDNKWYMGFVCPIHVTDADFLIQWIPGHMKVLGNELVDRMTKRSCDMVLEPSHWAHIDFSLGTLPMFRKRRLDQWRTWHISQGHGYYTGTPHDYHHLRGLSRLDFFAVIRIRSGTGIVGHDDCIGKDDRFHYISCNRYDDCRPRFETLFNNRHLQDWVGWIHSHNMLGLGIPSNTPRSGNVTVAYDNPFDGTACIVQDGRFITIDVVSPTYRCQEWHLVHSTAECPLPAFTLDGVLYFVSNDCTTCHVCSLRIGVSLRQRNRHFCSDSRCRLDAQTMFWHRIKLLWERFSTTEKVKLAAKWLYPATNSHGLCPGCHASYYCDTGSWLRRHLRVVSNALAGCWPALWIKFLTECDADGDDDADKLIVFKALGLDEFV